MLNRMLGGCCYWCSAGSLGVHLFSADTEPYKAMTCTYLLKNLLLLLILPSSLILHQKHLHFFPSAWWRRTVFSQFIHTVHLLRSHEFSTQDALNEWSLVHSRIMRFLKILYRRKERLEINIYSTFNCLPYPEPRSPVYRAAATGAEKSSCAVYGVGANPGSNR